MLFFFRFAPDLFSGSSGVFFVGIVVLVYHGVVETILRSRDTTIPRYTNINSLCSSAGSKGSIFDILICRSSML